MKNNLGRGGTYEAQKRGPKTKLNIGETGHQRAILQRKWDGGEAEKVSRGDGFSVMGLGTDGRRSGGKHTVLESEPGGLDFNSVLAQGISQVGGGEIRGGGGGRKPGLSLQKGIEGKKPPNRHTKGRFKGVNAGGRQTVESSLIIKYYNHGG